MHSNQPSISATMDHQKSWPAAVTIMASRLKDRVEVELSHSILSLSGLVRELNGS